MACVWFFQSLNMYYVFCPQIEFFSSVLPGTPLPKKRHKNPQPKNAVCALNELKTGAIYKVVGQTGPTHAPIFTIAVLIDGQTYEGKGRTKKMAKHAAAELALRNIVQFRNTPEVHQAINPCQTITPLEPDFTSDVTERDNHLVNAFKTLTQEPKNSNKFMDKGPVALINELYPGVVYKCISDSGESYAKFTIAVTIDGETFEGTGPSKKLAKAAASKAALAKLRNVHSSSFCIPLPVRILPNFSNSGHSHEQLSLPQMLSDKIGKMVNQKFTELMQTKPQHARRKVLAGIVQTKGQDAELICVTTGNDRRSNLHFYLLFFPFFCPIILETLAMILWL